jgi:hypothetical protein
LRSSLALRAVLVLLALVPAPGCATDGASPHPNLTRAWRDFEALPSERAMAIAGDPRRSQWVAALSGGHATPAEAEAGALAECRRRRAERRLQAACVLYGVGDEIVWRGP